MSEPGKVDRTQAFKNLNIRPDSRPILCIDGGGILTVQLLKEIENIAGMPCYELFDMVAGTSTGGIMAGLIASGMNAAVIEKQYEDLVTDVFNKRGFLHGRILNMPKYDKNNYRSNLEKLVGSSTTLASACAKTNIDLMITSKDVKGNEETFFTCFNYPTQQTGTYKDSLLRYVMEATMSAPTYFRPYERFIDGGTTAYNNPSLAAIMEAKRYGGMNKYGDAHITLFSMGTGMTVQSVDPEMAARPKVPAVGFWLNYVMDQSSQDASVTQVDTFRSGLIPNIDYRRFQVSFDKEAIAKLPDLDISGLNMENAKTLHQLTKTELNGIQMDDVTKFGLVSKIGEAMTQKIMGGNNFKADFIDPVTKRDVLVTAFGDVPAIQSHFTNPKWSDEVPTK